MAVITRFIPNTHVTRLTVLTDAFNQKAAVLPPQNIFSTGTSTRLDAIFAAFTLANTNVVKAEEDVGELSTDKQGTFVKLQRVCSHFIQVFNFAVEREVFSKDARLFYKLEKETGNLPDMASEDDLKKVATDLIAGEAARVAAGGAAMTNPAIADVIALNTPYNTQVTAHQTAALALIAAQKALNDLVPEADKVIKKIYDEAEATYNELDNDSQREACRQWGVIYISVGDNTVVTVQVVKTDGTPAGGVEVKLVQAGGKKLITNALGQVVFDTKVVGPATLEVRLVPGYQGEANKTQLITIVETVAMTVAVQL